MSVSKANTTFSVNLNKINKIAHNASHAISSGYKTNPTSAELMIGNSAIMKAIDYKASGEGLDSVLSLLDSTHNALSNMSETVLNLQNMVSNASDLSNAELASLEPLFNNMIAELDKIASNASYNGIQILDGTNFPLNISLPNNGGIIPLNISNAKNAASPIANPAANAAKIKVPATAQEIIDAISAPDNPESLLAELENLCGKRSFLYAIISQIYEAWKIGINNNYDVVTERLLNFHWNDILPNDAATSARALMNNQTFLNRAGHDFVILNLTMIEGNLQDYLYSLKYALQIIIQPLPTEEQSYSNIATPYIQKLSNELSLASAENIPIVEQRLKDTAIYISNIINQVTLNKMIIKNIQNCAVNSGIEFMNISSFALDADIIEEAAQLSLANNAIESVIFSMSFEAIMKDLITEAAKKILI